MSLPHSDACFVKPPAAKAFCDGHVSGFPFGGVPRSPLTTQDCGGPHPRRKPRHAAMTNLFEDRFGRVAGQGRARRAPGSMNVPELRISTRSAGMGLRVARVGWRLGERFLPVQSPTLLKGTLPDPDHDRPGHTVRPLRVCACLARRRFGQGRGGAGRRQPSRWIRRLPSG